MLKRFDVDVNEPDKRCAEEIPGHGMNRNRRQRIEKDFEKKDSKRRVICGIIGICISAVLTGVITGKRAEAVDEKMYWPTVTAMRTRRLSWRSGMRFLII